MINFDTLFKTKISKNIPWHSPPPPPPGDIYITRDSASLRYPNTEKRVDTTYSPVFFDEIETHHYKVNESVTSVTYFIARSLQHRKFPGSCRDPSLNSTFPYDVTAAILVFPITETAAIVSNKSCESL